MVTVDDVVRVIDEEAEEDLMKIVGASDTDFHAPPHIIAWRSVRQQAGAPPVDVSIHLNPAAIGNGLTGPSTEPRNQGMRRIEVDFSDPVQLKAGGSATITLWTTDTNGQIVALPPALS